MNIAQISNSIKSLFTLTETPAKKVPGPIMAIGGLQRTGLSATRSSAKIAEVLAKHGIPTEPNEDGSENKTLVEVIAIVEEIFRALQEDANIQVAFKPGDFAILSEGSGEGVIISNGTNINFPTGTGVLI
jgi:hypothetical protein